MGRGTVLFVLLFLVLPLALLLALPLVGGGLMLTLVALFLLIGGVAIGAPMLDIR